MPTISEKKSRDLGFFKILSKQQFTVSERSQCKYLRKDCRRNIWGNPLVCKYGGFPQASSLHPSHLPLASHTWLAQLHPCLPNTRPPVWSKHWHEEVSVSSRLLLLNQGSCLKFFPLIWSNLLPLIIGSPTTVSIICFVRFALGWVGVSSALA